jgi:hypothetical protein
VPDALRSVLRLSRDHEDDEVILLLESQYLWYLAGTVVILCQETGRPARALFTISPLVKYEDAAVSLRSPSLSSAVRRLTSVLLPPTLTIKFPSLLMLQFVFQPAGTTIHCRRALTATASEIKTAYKRLPKNGRHISSTSQSFASTYANLVDWEHCLHPYPQGLQAAL